ncbi:hypothetical protein [Streptomyces alboflavus]|uniref:hypothetical protein n=1 Tax=Streptomyces alboflavus TaxID=67267 RepID=UPI003693E547
MNYIKSRCETGHCTSNGAWLVADDVYGFLLCTPHRESAVELAAEFALLPILVLPAFYAMPVPSTESAQ